MDMHFIWCSGCGEGGEAFRGTYGAIWISRREPQHGTTTDHVARDAIANRSSQTANTNYWRHPIRADGRLIVARPIDPNLQRGHADEPQLLDATSLGASMDYSNSFGSHLGVDDHH